MTLSLSPIIHAVFAVVFGVFAMSHPAHGEEVGPTTEDLIAPIRAQLVDPDQPFDIFIKITLIPGQERAFEEAFASRMAATRAEPGNELFELSVHPSMPNVYMLHERWRDLASVEAHMEEEHMRTFWPLYFPMIARVPEFEVYATRDLVEAE